MKAYLTVLEALNANEEDFIALASTEEKDNEVRKVRDIMQGCSEAERNFLLDTLTSIRQNLEILKREPDLQQISIAGTLIKVDELANSLQVCLDSGAKKVLLPITSAADLSSVPAELIGCFNLIFYSSAEDAVYKALGVE